MINVNKIRKGIGRGDTTHQNIYDLCECVDELKHKLKIAMDGLSEILDWAKHTDDTGMAGGFAIANAALKNLRSKL